MVLFYLHWVASQIQSVLKPYQTEGMHTFNFSYLGSGSRRISAQAALGKKAEGPIMKAN
jgi:hypothetical protein